MNLKPYIDKTAFTNHPIEVTPEILRIWASQLEQGLKSALPGQMVDLQICNGIRLVAYKELNTLGYMKQIAAEVAAPIASAPGGTYPEEEKCSGGSCAVAEPAEA